jgi:Flp pilus assembly protein TadG
VKERWRANRQAKRRRKGERGQSLVELALTMPVLFLLLLGLIEFGHAFNSYLTVLASARDAARMAAQGGTGPTTLQNLIITETARLPTGSVPAANPCTNAAGGVCISGIDSSGDGTGGCPTLVSAKECVRVKVCYVHPFIVGIPFFDGGTSVRMCSETVMRLANEA